MSTETKSRFSEFEHAINKLVKSVKSEEPDEDFPESLAQKVYIRPHNKPDPDAISSSIALATILSLYEVESGIYFHRESPFFQNQAMNNLLDLKTTSNITRLGTLSKKIGKSELEKILASNRHAVLLDSGGLFSDSPDYKFIHPELIIDHHSKNNSNSGKKITKITPKIGANVSLFINYLTHISVPLSEPEHQNLRISAYYGIETDTSNFMQELMTQEDLEAKETLESVLTDEDKNILYKIRHPSIDRSIKRSYGKALFKHEIYSGDKLVVYCVPGLMTDGGVVPYIADKLFREEQLGKAVVVYGISDNTEDDNRYLELVASGRSLDSTINMPELFEETFYTKGDEGKREQFSGGTSIAQTGFSKAGATIPLPEFEDYSKEDLEFIWPTLAKKYNSRITKKYDIDPTKHD